MSADTSNKTVTTQSRTHTLTVDGKDYVVDFALCDDVYDARQAAQESFDDAYTAPDRPPLPEFGDTQPPQVARTHRGAAFVQVVRSRGSSNVAPPACRLSLVFEREGEVVQTELDEEQLRLLQKEIARVVGEMTAATGRIETYHKAASLYEDARFTRDAARKQIGKLAQQLWSEQYATDEDNEDGDELF